MSFQSPAFLVALVLVPLALAAYVLAQRRRRRYAARLADLSTLASVLPRSPRWRRHLPAALVLAALAALAIALARPQTTVSVPREEASIMLVTDTSGSMQATDVHPDRLDAAREAASRFLDKVPKRVRVGAVAFSNTALTLQRPTSDRQAVKDSLASLIPQGGTATGEGIRTALRALQPPKHHRRPPSAIVLLSDGKATSGSDPVEAARVAARAKTPIYTVALGTPGGVITFNQGFTGPQTIAVPPDPATLRRMAETSKGRFFDAGNASGLSQVYARLGSQLGTRQERREVTAAFAGGALLLLLAGAAMSLRWFGRLL